MFPYELPEETLGFLLEEQDLTPSAVYVKANDQTNLMKAVIAALYQLLTLVKEKDNGSEMQYNPEAIEELIKRYSRDIPEEQERKPQNRDMTYIW